jgi:glycosyltransferase involved in cell wall biosynthesis
MKVLSIGTDRKLFEENSPARERILQYGKKVEELHIVVFSLKSHDLEEIKISENVFLYPTNSVSKFLYVFDAIMLSRDVVIKKDFKRGDSVITCQDPYHSGLVGFIISFLFRLPLHIQIHTDIFSSNFKKGLLGKINYLLAKFLIPKADGLRVVSERIVNGFLKHNIKTKKQPLVLPIFVDKTIDQNIIPFDFHKNYPSFNFYILVVSRLEKEKRVKDILYALKEVLKKYSKVGLFIAGSGREENGLKSLAKKLKIDENVVFLGWRNDIKNLLVSASVLVQASEYEGYGMSIVEAGLYKCPVISSDSGLSGSLLKNGNNSLIFKVGDIIDMSNKIINLLERNDLRESLSLNLYSDLMNHLIDKETYIDKYISDIKSCL